MKLITDNKLRRKILKNELKDYCFKTTTEILCIHCRKIYKAKEILVYEAGEDEYILTCKTPDCSGNVIDMIDVNDIDEDDSFLFD